MKFVAHAVSTEHRTVTNEFSPVRLPLALLTSLIKPRLPHIGTPENVGLFASPQYSPIELYDVYPLALVVSAPATSVRLLCLCLKLLLTV